MSSLRGWISTIGLFLLGMVLLAWGVSQVSADLRGIRQPAGEEERVVDAPLPTGLATQQANLRKPTFTPNATLSAQKTQDAADQAEGNTFLDTSTEIEDHSEIDEVLVPTRLLIPAIELDAPIMEAVVRMVEIWEKNYPQWEAPNEFAAGWHTNTAGLRQAGNLVLNGHHNVYGEVFGRLIELKPGDEIRVYSGATSRRYQITNSMILPEKYQPLEVRLENARWLEQTEDERLTLVTCYPYESNTHRLVIVAQPVK